MIRFLFVFLLLSTSASATDSFMQAAPDSTGKKVQTFNNNIGANDVHAQGVVQVTSAGLERTAWPVTGTFWQATQPVSGSLTISSGSITISNATLAVTQSGAWTVQPGNTANTTAWKVDGSAVTQPVSGTFWQATQPVSGTFWQATQPVSLATLAQLPTALGTTGGLKIEEAERQTFYAAGKFTPAVTVSRDFWRISGSATKTVRVRRIWISGTSTAAQYVDLVVIKRSAANTGGTSSAPANVKADSNNASATAAVAMYTAVGTEGATGADFGPTWNGQGYLGVATIAATSPVPPVLLLDFTPAGPAQSVVLRGVAQGLCLQVSTVLSAAPSLRIAVEWTEE